MSRLGVLAALVGLACVGVGQTVQTLSNDDQVGWPDRVAR